tara:strand:- start:1340 stop:1585 length:246 start_codon:yes stop_codon:yes gene_type:complete
MVIKAMITTGVVFQLIVVSILLSLSSQVARARSCQSSFKRAALKTINESQYDQATRKIFGKSKLVDYTESVVKPQRKSQGE